MNTPRRHTLVLGLYPTTRGFAFALFEGPLSPYDWGVSYMKGGKNEWCLKKVSGLLDRYTPDAIVLQDMSSTGTRRVQRIRTLNGAIEKLAEARRIPVFSYSRRQVRTYFPPPHTRRQIAETIANHIPAFEGFLPPIRKIWKSENPHMSLFDAAALVLTHYQGCAD